MADALDAAQCRDPRGERRSTSPRPEAAGTARQLVDRLALDPPGSPPWPTGLREVAALPDPIGDVVRGFTQPNGLQISQVRVPFGVLAMVYEARPNVTVDAAGLGAEIRQCGAAARLGQRDPAPTALLVSVLSEAAAKAGLPADCVQLVPGTDRSSVGHLLRARGLVDVVIPRGGAGLISYVVENSSVPVIETGIGNVHVYVDADADLDMAERIVLNSKVSRPSVCNAAESLLVHRTWPLTFLPRITAALQAEGVTVHGDERSPASPG